MTLYLNSYAKHMADLTKKEKMERKDPLVQLYALDLGENLRIQREARGLTQEDLGLMIGTQHPRISDMERGLVDIRLSDIIKLARVFEIRPDNLVDFSKYELATIRPRSVKIRAFSERKSHGI